ncbi:BXL6 [Symbiodinium sp. KB8]|nr:BXL6 [Symbiodinium sp. KB8]
MRAGAASAARWARCRNAHCSLWARNLNAKLQFHRGLAASPLLRLAAEPMPISGFVEQRSCGSSLISNVCASGEEADAMDVSVAAAQAGYARPAALSAGAARAEEEYLPAAAMKWGGP